MPRKRRITTAHHVYHVVNRGAKKARLFEHSSDYHAFEQLLSIARTRFQMRILAYCLMPNHWHLLLWPRGDRDLSSFGHWLGTTHATRWNRENSTISCGAVYQSRFKSIPIENGPHLFWAWRYVERNALRAQLVDRAEEWRWSSLWIRCNQIDGFLDEGPIQLPDDWIETVNVPQTELELTVFRSRVATGQPYGSQNWLTSEPARRGRPPNLRKT